MFGKSIAEQGTGFNIRWAFKISSTLLQYEMAPGFILFKPEELYKYSVIELG